MRTSSFNAAIFLLVELFITCSNDLFAQASPVSDTLHINSVRARVQSNGAFFLGGENGQFLVPAATGSTELLSLIKSAGLWLGGKDPNGNIRLSAQVENKDGKTDFYPGLLSADAQPLPEFNLIASVTKPQIEAHIANPFPPSAPMRRWPASGNQYFFDAYGFDLPFNHPGGLAPFYDNGFNGYYNPDGGDYPAIGLRGCQLDFGAGEALWFPFHDVGAHTQTGAAPLFQEIQTELFGFDCPEGSPANRAVYVIYKFINRDTVVLDSCYFGIYLDFEIGNGDDDFIGCNSSRRLVYAYNGDPVDEGGFENTPPVVGVDLLRGPFNSDTGEEVSKWTFVPVDDSKLTSPRAYFNLLAGKRSNGVPFPNQGKMYTGDPLDPAAWSEISDGNTPGDRQALAAFGPFRLLPGAVNELVLGYFWVRKNPNGSVTDNLSALLDNDNAIQGLFDNCFELFEGCPANVSVSHPGEALQIQLSPNPFADEIRVESLADPINRLVLYNNFGQTVRQLELGGAESARMPTSDVPKGFYWMEVRTQLGKSATFKVIKQ